MNPPRDQLLSLFQRTWDAAWPSVHAPAEVALDAAPAQLPALVDAVADRQLVTAGLLRWLYTRNQFAQLDAAARAELEESVGRTLLAIDRTQDASEPLEKHRSELLSFLRARFGARPREVVCADYAPELQLAVLGLHGDELREPVLDVGCGERAALVRLLRELGLSAHGVDRHIEPALDPDVARQADWLTHPYGHEKYGTILSHLGFTLHFLHHHLAGGDTAFAYARTYMAILAALLPGGCFVYTPGLPFLESMLDASMYRVQRVPFADELRVTSLRQIEATTGLALSHSTHVERLR